jgi:Ca2+-binding RTX toxin-like protein
VAALATALLLPASAHAGTASVAGDTLTYADSPGRSTKVNWGRDSDSIAIQESARDTGALTSTAGAGCVVYSSNMFSSTFVCSAAGVASVRIDLGDGDDQAEPGSTSAFNPPRFFEDLNFPVTVLGGDGKDGINGGPAADTLDGGPGDDLVFNVRSGASQVSDLSTLDVLSGGPGNDTLSGGATLDGGDGDDGMASGVNVPAATLRGGPGADNLEGGNGADSLDGGDGKDTLNGTEGADRLAGGGDSDTLMGGEGADTLDGGDGADSLEGERGKDSYSAGAGDDKLDAADDVAETLDCGAGRDTVTNWDDGKDRAVPATSCEVVPDSPVRLDGRRSKALGYAAAARTGRLRVRVRCLGTCAPLRAGVLGWQFLTTHGPRKAYGSNCAAGRRKLFKRTSQGWYEATLGLNACQKRTLKSQVAQEKRHELRFRRFVLSISARSTRGELNIGGKR